MSSERDAKQRADATNKRRTNSAFENLIDANREAERRDKSVGHPSKEPDRNPWEKPDGPEGR